MNKDLLKRIKNLCKDMEKQAGEAGMNALTSIPPISNEGEAYLIFQKILQGEKEKGNACYFCDKKTDELVSWEHPDDHKKDIDYLFLVCPVCEEKLRELIDKTKERR